MYKYASVIYNRPQNVLQSCATCHRVYFSHVKQATECTSVMYNMPWNVLQSSTTCHRTYFSHVQHAMKCTSVMCTQRNVLQSCAHHRMYFSQVQQATECTSVMYNKQWNVQNCTTHHGMNTTVTHRLYVTEQRAKHRTASHRTLFKIVSACT